MGKQRISASVDADLAEAGQAAVASGEVDTFSGWVNQALRRQVDHDRRLRAIDGFLAGFEAEHGEITAEQVSEAARRARARAVVVRGEVGGGRSGRGVA
ncbi:MAG TPA: hypothetical protein VKP11_05570 [Frankiaceae bacterium]|nr:hypothetical protein [Frankiaceae bacterium]